MTVFALADAAGVATETLPAGFAAVPGFVTGRAPTTVVALAVSVAAAVAVAVVVSVGAVVVVGAGVVVATLCTSGVAEGTAFFSASPFFANAKTMTRSATTATPAAAKSGVFDFAG